MAARPLDVMITRGAIRWRFKAIEEWPRMIAAKGMSGAIAA
jgi:hypothetical protein